MKNYILYSTLLCIFLEGLVIRGIVPFDLRFYYFVYILNLFIILLSKQSLHIRLGHVFTYLTVVSTSLYGLALGHNTMSLYLFQVIGILICSLFYSNFFRLFAFDIKKIFELYVDLSFVFAILGILSFCLLKPISPNIVHSVESTMSEPAVYAYTVLPAVYYSLQKSVLAKKIQIKTVVLIVSILLSGSSLGYIGLVLSCLFLIKKVSLIKVVSALLLAFGLFAGIYTLSEKFKVRVDDSYQAITTQNLKETNLSTYALLSNAFVAIRSFDENPLIGNGLGSHPISHKRFVGDIEGIEFFSENMDLNAKDASSLFLRVMSELGLVGLIMIFYFLFKFFIKKSKNNETNEFKIIQKAVLIYFIIKLLRAGHYFSPEFYFFVFVYYLAYAYRHTYKTENLSYSEQ